MSTKITVGSVAAVQNSETVSYSPAGGYKFSGSFAGLKDSLRPLIAQLAGLGYTFTYHSEESPNATIDFDSAGDPGGGGTETPTLVWEYFANRIEIDMLEADIAGINTISESDKRTIREHINNPKEGESPSVTGNALIAYRLMLDGVRSAMVNWPTLKVSKLVSSTYAVQASQTNVGRIITTASLTATESIPTRLFALPNDTTTKTDRVYGWLKSFPNIQQAAGGRWNIAQEWQYGLWATLLYGAAV